jgi:hypothetical protein
MVLTDVLRECADRHKSDSNWRERKNTVGISRFASTRRILRNPMPPTTTKNWLTVNIRLIFPHLGRSGISFLSLYPPVSSIHFAQYFVLDSIKTVIHHDLRFCSFYRHFCLQGFCSVRYLFDDNGMACGVVECFVFGDLFSCLIRIEPKSELMDGIYLFLEF